MREASPRRSLSKSSQGNRKGRKCVILCPIPPRSMPRISCITLETIVTPQIVSPPGGTSVENALSRSRPQLNSVMRFVLLILLQRRLKFENLKLHLLELLQRGNPARVDSVAQVEDHPHEKEEGASELK